MLIRKQQMQLFEDTEVRRFTDFMRDHLRRHFPRHCEALDADGLDRAIAAGIERAASHRIVSERDVCKFIDLQFAFGEAFDQKQPWAAEVFADVEIRNPTTRVEELMNRAEAHLASLRKENGAG